MVMSKTRKGEKVKSHKVHSDTESHRNTRTQPVRTHHLPSLPTSLHDVTNLGVLGVKAEDQLKSKSADIQPVTPSPSLLAALSISGLTPEAQKVVTQLSVLEQDQSEVSSEVFSKQGRQVIYQHEGTRQGLPPMLEADESAANRKLKLVYERVSKIIFPRKRLKKLFKKMVRLVVYQLNLLSMINMRDPSDYLEVRAVEEFLAHQEKHALFNKQLYKKKFSMKLSRKMMYIMRKEPEERSQAEVNMVQEFMKRIRMQPLIHLMKGRSQAVKHDFARILRFIRVPAGRIIVRQGHTATSIYLLVRGEVVVIYTTLDKHKGGAVANVVAVEGDGYDFGAGDDGFQSYRVYTVVSKETCDLVWIDREDFEMLQEVVDEADRRKAREFLVAALPSSLKDEEALEFCLRHCVYRQYPPNTEIRLDEFIGEKQTSKYVFFVYKGVCLQYRRLHLISRIDRFGNKLIALDTSIHQDDKKKNETRAFSTTTPKQLTMLPSIVVTKKAESISSHNFIEYLEEEQKTAMCNQVFITQGSGEVAKSGSITVTREHNSLSIDTGSVVTHENIRELHTSSNVKFRQNSSDMSAEPLRWHPTSHKKCHIMLDPTNGSTNHHVALERREDLVEEFNTVELNVTKRLVQQCDDSCERRYVVRSVSNYLRPMDCFGTGELHRNTVYKTPKSEPVEFIVIPRDAFESRISLTHELHMLSDQLNYNRQTSPEIYKQYKLKKEWHNFKKETVQQIISESPKISRIRMSTKETHSHFGQKKKKGKLTKYL